MDEGEHGGEALTLLSACLLAFIAASPLYIAHPDKGPALSPAYTVVCLAFIAGQVAGGALRAAFSPGERARAWALCLAAAVAEVFLLPEWALLGEYAASLAGGGTFECLAGFRQLICAAQPYALPGACFLAGTVAPLPAAGEKRADVPAAPALRSVMLAALAMAAGYAPRVIWRQFFPVEGGSVVPAALLAPTLLPKLLPAVALLAYLALVIVLIRLWRARGAGLPPAVLGSSYALGMFLWALLTRVFPVWGSAALAASPLLVALLAPPAIAGALHLVLHLVSRLRAKTTAGDADPLAERAASCGLTAREHQVVACALAGKKSAEIASELGISSSTVRGTLAKAYKKIGVANLGELKGLVGPADAAATRDNEGRSPVARLGSRLLFAAGALPLVPVVSVSGGWGDGQPLVLGAGFALVAWATVGFSLVGRAPSREAERARATAAAVLAAGDAAALLSLVLRIAAAPAALRPFGPAAEFAAGAGITLALLLAMLGDGAPAGRAPTPFSACFALGLCLEELWRSVYTPAGLAGLLPFALVAGLSAIKLLAFAKAERRRLDAIVAVTALLGMGGVLQPWFAWCLALAPAAVLAVKQCREGCFSPAAAFAGCLALGCGALAGAYAMNVLGDWCLRWQALPLSGVERRLLGAAPAAATLLLSLPGIVSVRLACGREAARIGQLAVPSESERIRGFLVSRGLNAVESQTAVLIAEGLTTREIAEKLCYSMGAVNSARRGAYAKLGVRSKSELVSLFAQFRG